jgi:VanZ family protein
VTALSKTSVSHRWWWLPTIYLVFLGYQSLVGASEWTCKRGVGMQLPRWLGWYLADFLANFLAYVPLGFLLAAPKVATGFKWPFLFATALGFSFSLLMEALQLCIVI